MNFYNILLLLAGIYATFLAVRVYLQKRELLYVCYGLAVFSVTVAFLNPIVDYVLHAVGYQLIGQPFLEWGRICAVSFVLCGLIEFIRISKPDFARFPQIFVAFPLLLIITYPLISHTLVLKEWLIASYEGGAILIGFTMHGFQSRKKTNQMMVLLGIIVLLLSYIIYWLPGDLSTVYSWVWKLFLAAGLIILMKGYERIEPINEELQTVKS